MASSPSPSPDFHEPPAWVAEEQAALDRVLPALRALQQADAALDQEYVARVKEAHAALALAMRERIQREAMEEALEAEKQALQAHRAARKSRELPLGTPYFARLVLDEGHRRQELMLGKVGVVEGGLRIVDWRHAPVSRIYYEYEEGEEYEEELAGRVREGRLAARRRVDLRSGVLVEAQRGDEVLRRTPAGAFLPPARADQRAEREDHHLPDIVSLITREQFAVIAQREAGVVLLRGRAGSGKTTVALHRVAWLHFQDPRRFRASDVLIVMFNKALRTYITKVLPELGVPGVGADTFHAWASRMLREGGIEPRFAPPGAAEVGRLKRHPGMEAAVDATLHQLGQRLGAWVVEKVPEADRAWTETWGHGLARLAQLFTSAAGGPLAGALRPLRAQVLRRLSDHRRDLWTMLEDPQALAPHLPPTLHGALPQVAMAAARCREKGELAFEDVALLLRLGQEKRRHLPELEVPWSERYAHVVIDEAQDLGALELASLVGAADAAKSVTIAGDPAQRILEDAWFDGFEPLLERLGAKGTTDIRLQALQVGHRSTRPIMELALRALGTTSQGDLAVAAARDGEAVQWLECGEPTGGGADEAAWIRAAAGALRAFRQERPRSLVAVLCLPKAAADRWAKGLHAAGVADVRRAERADFQFTPGVVVSNVHQVKGLEFDGVVLVDPAAYRQRDRFLLHVAITRAADRLWVVAPRGPGALLGGR